MGADEQDSTCTTESDNETIYHEATKQPMDRSEMQLHSQRTSSIAQPTEGAIQGGQYNHPTGPQRKNTRSNSIGVRSGQTTANGYPPNIVIFGETGVGKSSIINLITGEKRAHTSNAALGCTFKHERYNVNLDGVACTLWDTTGLDEGTEGTVPADVAERNLRELIEELARAGGIHLVIYCIRGNRLTRALKRNYDLFYVAVCRRKVPVALVVTGLEHREGGMETWWNANRKHLEREGMLFHECVCVTTVEVDDRTIQDRRFESQDRLRKLVTEYSKRPPWRIKMSFLSRVSSTLRGVLMKTFSAGRSGDIKTIRKVIIYDITASPETLTQVSPGITALHQRSRGMIGDKEYEFVRLDKHAVETELQREEGAGVLVFYTSPISDEGVSKKDIATLKTFYDNVGQTCPVIVVLRGCDDAAAAKAVWANVILEDSDIRADPTFFPITENGQSNRLNRKIELECIEHIEVAEPRAGKLSSLWAIGKHVF